MLTQEEIALLEKNPETAAVAKKLKEDQEKFIPKTRFDETNERMKKAEEELAKRLDAEKKAAETKQLEEGKTKEVLTQREAELETTRKEKDTLATTVKQLEEKAKAFEDAQAVIRKTALDKIKDPELKKIAEQIPSVADVVSFAEKMQKKVSTTSGNHQSASNDPNEKPEFKSLAEAEAYYRQKGIL